MIDFAQFMLMVFMALCLYAIGLFLHDKRKMREFINKCIVMFMNLFDRGDDIDWLNMHNDMIEKGERNESK